MADGEQEMPTLDTTAPRAARIGNHLLGGEDDSQVAPDSRIVYVDNDPRVLAHARAPLTTSPEGVTDHIAAGPRDSDTILGRIMVRLPSGSYLAMDDVSEANNEAVRKPEPGQENGPEFDQYCAAGRKP